MSKVTLRTLHKHKTEGRKFAVLTAYDAAFAGLFAEAGVEAILVGDSMGNVIQGRNNTLPVTMDEMIYHTAMVTRGAVNAFVIADMPFMSCNSPQETLSNAGRLMKEGGAQMVKVEGDGSMAESVALLNRFGIPVCAHLGLLPQFVHKRGYKVRGRGEGEARDLRADSLKMVEAGADMLLFECVPRALAAEITAEVPVPVIGIGAGPECDAQVLVSYDMLGITPGKRPSFSHDFLAESGGSIQAAVEAYVAAVKAGTFPAEQHCFE